MNEPNDWATVMMVEINEMRRTIRDGIRYLDPNELKAVIELIESFNRRVEDEENDYCM